MDRATGAPEIRTGEPDDATAIADLAQRTFRETYADQTDADDMDAFLADAYRPAELAAQLDDARHRFFVVEDGDRAVGFAHLVLDEPNPAVSATRPALLAEIYLERTQQGRGLGAALMQRAIEAARDAGCDVLWLGVWELNAPAIGFYRRWGFTEVGEVPFEFGSVRHRDLVMTLSLPAG